MFDPVSCSAKLLACDRGVEEPLKRNIQIRNLIVVSPKKAGKLLTCLARGINEQGLNGARKFSQGQIGLRHKEGPQAKKLGEQTQDCTATVSFESPCMPKLTLCVARP